MITRVARPEPELNRAITKSYRPSLRLVAPNFSRPPEPLGAGLFGDPRPEIIPQRLMVEAIKAEVARHFSLPIEAMTSGSHRRKEARPRQVSMYLAFNLSSMSKCEIGRRHGNKDHSTVHHAINQIERLRLIDPELDHNVRALEQGLAR